MAVHTAQAEWKGNLIEGSGTVKTNTGTVSASYNWKARSADGPSAGVTTPEELIAAAHAACFSMALSAALGKNNFPPKSVRTTAKVTFDKVGEGFGITRIDLSCEAQVPGLDDAAKFKSFADGAKAGCPVSKALASVPTINLEAKLVSA